MKSVLRCAAVVAVVFAALPAFSQTPESCKGTLEVVRFTALKPGSTIDDFRKIVDQHMAWYRKHGFTKNQQIVAPVVTPSGVDPTKLVTIHLNAPGLTQDQHDAEWDDFVTAYRKISSVEAMRTVCIPR